MSLIFNDLKGPNFKILLFDGRQVPPPHPLKPNKLGSHLKNLNMSCQEYKALVNN